MRAVNNIVDEITTQMNFITGYEKTKLIVVVDRIISKPWINHRADFNCYSIRYKSSDKRIYIYSKPYEYIEMFDFDYKDDVEFSTDFNVCITLDSKIEQILNNMKEVVHVCVKKLIKNFSLLISYLL
jgi:hypothetical protein